MAEAGAKRYYWLKLQEDFFGGKRMKKLRRLSGGDTCVIIYLKMQLLAMKNDGVLEFTGLEESFAEELALDLDEDAETVEATVGFLLSCGLLETSDQRAYYVPEAVLNTGSEGASAKRVREHRGRKVLQSNGDVTEEKQSGNGEKEKEKEIEKELETDTETEPSSAPQDAVCRADAQRVVDAWNSLGLSKVTKIVPNKERDRLLRARIREYGVELLLQAIERIRSSDFLLGKNRNGWVITFDWFIRPNNFPKVLDGNYERLKGAIQNGADSGNSGEVYGEWL